MDACLFRLSYKAIAAADFFISFCKQSMPSLNQPFRNDISALVQVWTRPKMCSDSDKIVKIGPG